MSQKAPKEPILLMNPATTTANSTTKKNGNSINLPPMASRSDNDDKEKIQISGDWKHTEYRNNPQNILNVYVDTSASIEDCHQQIQHIVETLCPFLLHRRHHSDNNNSKDNKKDDDDDNRFEINPLTGGLSNLLFLVSNSNFSTDTARITGTVLVRIHPDNNGNNDTDTNNNNKESKEIDNFSIVDREQETRFASWLAKQQQQLPHVQDEHKNKTKTICSSNTMAPTVYGRFENGRVEEFYENVSPLSCSQMKVYAPWVAQSLASFHQLDAPPIDALPRPSTNFDATLYETIHDWLKKANELNIVDDDKDLLKELCEEWIWLEKELGTSYPTQQPSKSTNDDNPIVVEALGLVRRVVVTHMDCQPLNILIDNNNIENNNDKNIFSSINLKLIDFEYSGWNPIAADIANTFCEYCEMSNLCADYEREYPTLAQQDVFFWNYLLQYDPIRVKQFSSYPRRIKQSLDYVIVDDYDDEWKLFLTTCSNEVGRFSLLSHLGWAIWSIVKAQEEDGVDFDYMVYARHRMDGYTWAKNNFLQRN